MTNTCYICQNELIEYSPTTKDYDYFSCPRCGKYNLSGTLVAIIRADGFQLKDDNVKIAKASYKIRNLSREGHPPPVISQEQFNNFLQEELPPLSEQLDKLVKYIAENSQHGVGIRVDSITVMAFIGAAYPKTITFLMNTLNQFGYLENMIGFAGSSFNVMLSYEGWQYFMEIEAGDRVSNKAFIAMKFGDEVLDQLVNNHIREAVRQTGFRLERVDDNKEAGLIDSKIRVQIRTSRFLIVDLSHDNNGAYWEAGFAEGLGKPVIYICEKAKFNDTGTHFDTNHQLTVLWDLDSPEEIRGDLKAVIRATLPKFATLEDE